jgi:hypothetical protein
MLNTLNILGIFLNILCVLICHIKKLTNNRRRMAYASESHTTNHENKLIILL